MDLETIYCKLLHNRDRSFIPLIEAEPVHFLCTYKTHCFALCHCCDFDACDCEMTCPNNCTCFHDQSWSTNVVECSGAGYTEMPSNIPMDTTELYIDGNDLVELSEHSFIGRKNLKVLYANHSNIQVIYNTTFHGLRKLTTLHLENNMISRFNGHEMGALENLRELYLQYNHISFIGNGTFMELRKLQVLRLDNNRLINFEVWQLTLNPYLVEIALAENQWSCECSYLHRFRNYLATNNEKIMDSNRIACVYNNLTSILKEKNGAKCTLKDGISTIVRPQDIENLLPLLLVATCAFVGFFCMIIGIFCYRNELKIWAHTHCLPAMCYKSANFIDDFDKDRLYDAYITYSLQDEHFVNQILANTLENDVGYRMCLHYRDFNVNTYVADTIVEAVESSKRAILVLSRNFLNNEWSRFEFKSAIHEVLKRRRKFIFILYGNININIIDAGMLDLLRSSTCIEWDDKKFWQKLRMALPHIRKNNSMAKRSAVNIYATAAQNYNTASRRQAEYARRLDCNNYATINDCVGGGGPVGSSTIDGRNSDKYDTVSCKYNTANERQRHHGSGANNGGSNSGNSNSGYHSAKTLDRHRPHYAYDAAASTHGPPHHEYAVPTNCLKGSSGGGGGVGGGPYDDYSNSCEHIGDSYEHSGSVGVVAAATGKYPANMLRSCSADSSANNSACSVNSGGKSASNSVAGVVASGDCSGGNHGGISNGVYNSYNNSSTNNSNCCNNSNCADDECCNNKCDLNCTLDRRLPQAMWA